MFRSSHNPQGWQPRSFEELYNDYAYLQTLLQAEAVKYYESMQQILCLNTSLYHPDVFYSRKVKKQIGWHKHRLHETTRQEIAILGSLGHLNHEMQCRESQNRFGCENRTYMQAAIQQGMMLSPITMAPVINQPLDPRSVILAPHDKFMPWSAPLSNLPQISNLPSQHPAILYGLEMPTISGRDIDPESSFELLLLSDALQASSGPAICVTHPFNDGSSEWPAFEKPSLPILPDHVFNQATLRVPRSTSPASMDEKLDYSTNDCDLSASSDLAPNKRASMPVLRAEHIRWELGCDGEMEIDDQGGSTDSWFKPEILSTGDAEDRVFGIERAKSSPNLAAGVERSKVRL